MSSSNAGQFDDAGQGGSSSGSGEASRKRKAEEEVGGDYDEATAKKWAEVPRLGNLVGAGPFIPCKRPLSAAANEKVDEGDRFDSGMFMDRQVTARRDVGLIIALLDPTKGLPLPDMREWEDWDCEYSVIIPENAQQVASAMHKTALAFLEKNPRRMIAVFCDDGTNLSGYAIVSFLCRAQKMPLPDALSAFAAARSPGIYHQPYLDDLWLTLGAGKGAMAGPKPPPWAMDLPMVPAHGAFSLPAMPAKKQATGAGTADQAGGGSEDGLPPGWSKHWSKSRNTHYYFNKTTGKQSWEKPGAAPAPFPAAKPNQMGALHILIKHKGSRRPASWKDESGDKIKARSVADAVAKAKSFRAEITGAPDPKAKFREVAKRESDCSSAHREGDLGPFSTGKMQPLFEAAVVALSVGGISGPVETESGVHLIFRTI